ncbi:hypothetical protein [Levilactobacillus namurensis]|uniref:hypothetical protein n=1 Tax=Levilactobacillus namurensis TaxID=380393 RepID=UPI0026EA0517|nr:hypothetical protein [Levilactobacillus namurensis]
MKIQDFYNPLKRTLLISLHSQYVSEIECEKKIIEYRKRFFKYSFQAFVCTTGKNGGIELFLDCDTPIISNASKLAEIGVAIQNDDYQEIYKYFEEKNTGVIIPIKQAITFTKIPRSTLLNAFSSFVVPQAYSFLDTPSKKELLNNLLKNECKNNWTLDWDENYSAIGKLITR